MPHLNHWSKFPIVIAFIALKYPILGREVLIHWLINLLDSLVLKNWLDKMGPHS